MSQNIVALIIFLALVALAVIGTLAFSALVDRGERRRRSRVTRHRENDVNRSKAASRSDPSQSGSSDDDTRNTAGEPSDTGGSDYSGTGYREAGSGNREEPGESNR